MHSVAKIVCKMLASRLAPELPMLVSANQSAFIKGRSIQDNFLYVQNVIREANRRKKSLIFLKLDIAKAFDSVRWDFLFEVLQGFGFDSRWRDLISILLDTASSRVLLNGIPGSPFRHRRGLRQGDPLSPMLFILAMEPLQRILDRATAEGILSPLPLSTARTRTSFYADDAAIFVNPVKEEIEAVMEILAAFGAISGLQINILKCQAFPIKCEGLDIGGIMSSFGGVLGVFPCKYLGLPLGFRKPRRVEIQPLLDKMAMKLQNWKGKLINRAGRLVLINSVLTATTTYFLTVFPADSWAIKKMDKMRRNFLWAGDEQAHGGKCLVNWIKVCRPKKLGGLGIKNIQNYSRALRLRWPWFRWDSRERPWLGSKVPCNESDLSLFTACTRITIGDGNKTSFWADRWLQGEAPKDIALDIFKISRKKQITVSEAVHEGRWMQGVQNISTAQAIDQLAALWGCLQGVQLTDVPDSIGWNFSVDGSYSARSAYSVHFVQSISQPLLSSVWSIKGEGKVRFFLWLLLQNRLWTADRLAARGWPHNALCLLCDQVQEGAAHLMIHCVFAKEVWHASSVKWPRVGAVATASPSLRTWWRQIISGPKSASKDKEIAMAALIAWHLWKERNSRVFQQKEMNAAALYRMIEDEYGLLMEAR